MGVLSCDRRDCENIMCDRYSCKYGHICDDCFDELVKSGVTDIGHFMNTPKRDMSDNYTFYNEIFPDREEQEG